MFANTTIKKKINTESINAIIIALIAVAMFVSIFFKPIFARIATNEAAIAETKA